MSALKFNLLGIFLFLFIIIILVFGLKINVFSSNTKIHEYIQIYIGWITTFVFGSMVFVTLTISSIKNSKYNNISALKYFMECKELNSPFFRFESNMSAKEDIFCILFINILMMIMYFINFDFIIFFLSIYLLLLLFGLIESSLANIHIEESNKLFQIAMANYIEKVITSDLKNTKLQIFGKWIDFDINLLFSVHNYIVEYKYENDSDPFKKFQDDTIFFRINLKYIKENNKIEYVASYYNLQLYFDSLVSIIDKNQNDKYKKFVKEELNKIEYIISDYLSNYENSEWYKERYAEMNKNIKKVYNKYKL